MRKALKAMSWGLALMIGCGAVALRAEGALRTEPACPGAFPAPIEPMLLSRQLRRSLFDGQEIVVTRHYRLNFVRIPHGFRIDGVQVDAEVQAPERLAALAQMERVRLDTTTFPIYLDRAGLIVTLSGPVRPHAKPNVVSVAQQMIAASRLKGQERGQANQFVEQLFSRDGPVISLWPEALFRPNTGPRITRDHLILPGGESGEVTMTLIPRSAHVCALVESMERIIETEVVKQKRRATELWILIPKRIDQNP